MRRPALVRRRTVRVPTGWGWLVLLLAGGATLLLLGRALPSFLAPSRPVGAPLLVVEGWLPAAELDEALAAWRRGGYERVVTTGGPIEDPFEPAAPTTTYAARARGYLVRRGLPPEAVIAVPAPASAQDRTFLSAVVVREWAAGAGSAVDALDLFSSGVHARRSWLLYRMAFGPTVRIGILAVRPSGYRLASWWRTSAGAEEVLGETIRWLWTKAFFRPGAPGTHAERWGIERPAPTAGSPGGR